MKIIGKSTQHLHKNVKLSDLEFHRVLKPENCLMWHREVLEWIDRWTVEYTPNLDAGHQYGFGGEL